jgi:hypothetical protein
LPWKIGHQVSHAAIELPCAPPVRQCAQRTARSLGGCAPVQGSCKLTTLCLLVCGPSCAGMEVPLVGQLRIIHQGRFLDDNKALSEHKVADGEQTAMHLIIKSEVSKPTGVCFVNAARQGRLLLLPLLPLLLLATAVPCAAVRKPTSHGCCMPCANAESASASDDKAPKCSCIVC